MQLSCPIIAVPLFSTKVAFTQFQADYRFPSNRKLYEILVSYGREPCWQHVTTSECSKLPAPWLKVMLMLHFFGSVSILSNFLCSFLPTAFKSLCFYTVSRLSMFLDLTVVWCVNSRCCGNLAVWSVCCSLYSSSIFPESRQYEISFMFQVHIQKGNHRFGCFGHSKL